MFALIYYILSLSLSIVVVLISAIRENERGKIRDAKRKVK